MGPAEAEQRRLRRGIHAVPFVFSLGLSLSTMGPHPYWQDSALYLTASKDLNVLYPPGFPLYVVLARLWSLLFFFLDHAHAIHLLSAVCAAGAASVLGVVVRDLILAREGLFRTFEEADERSAAWSGAAAGALMASGYTFWSTAIYAKGYSLYYLVLAVLLWRMLRASGSRNPREFTRVAALIGLAWAVHPSAALLGPALLLYAASQARLLGWRGLGGRALVAAACALGPTLILLPLLVARDGPMSMGDPRGLGELLRYATGRRFVAAPGVFGWEPSRAASVGLYLWEEFLGVGLAAVVAGVAWVAVRNRRLLLGMAAWVLPYVLVTVAFKIEGQHDCWFVAAWMPLFAAMGLGLHRCAALAGRWGRALRTAAVLAGAAWATVLNAPLVDAKSYGLSEDYGRMHLAPLEPGALLLTFNDDTAALAGYLQSVRGERRDVILVFGGYLFASQGGSRDWYDDRLRRAHPFLNPCDYRGLQARMPGVPVDHVALAAFVEANAACGRPIYSEIPPLPGLLPPGWVQVPAGPVWKLAPGPAGGIDPAHWRFPVEAEEVARRYRRARGQRVEAVPGGMRVTPEPYEARLVRALLKARRNLAGWLAGNGRAFAALRLYESVLGLDPAAAGDPSFSLGFALAHLALGDAASAEPLFVQALEGSPWPREQARALFHLAEIARGRDEEERALWLFDQAFGVPGLDPAFRQSLMDASTGR
jgi:hypothetical protein